MMGNEQIEPAEGDQNDLWEDEWSKERVCLPAETLPLDEPVYADKVRFVCISDTHERLHEMIENGKQIPNGDVLLHCGDFTNTGSAKAVDIFNDDIGKLPHPYKIVIAGNHELGFEDGEDVEARAELWGGAHFYGSPGTPQGYKRLTNCIYLQDSSTKIYGLTVYGSAWHSMEGFSFYRPRGAPILKEWLKVPPSPAVDVLMTHTPPLGHSDKDAKQNEWLEHHWGCADLLNCVEKRIKPKVHVFGHVHERPYATTNGHTLFINAACCDNARRGPPPNPAKLFDLPLPEGVCKK